MFVNNAPAFAKEFMYGALGEPITLENEWFSSITMTMWSGRGKADAAPAIKHQAPATPANCRSHRVKRLIEFLQAAAVREPLLQSPCPVPPIRTGLS
jgi:hypothetical protein